MTALEKAAKAMYEVHQACIVVETISWGDQNSYVKSSWFNLARAAIESLRTPGVENTDRIFNAMLDRILKEEV